MEHRMLHLILVTYLRPLSEVDPHLEGHRSFLRKHYDAGHFLMSGRREPRTGGVILAIADSRDDVARWVSEDPFAQAGIASYEIIGWTPTMMTNHWPCQGDMMSKVMWQAGSPGQGAHAPGRPPWDGTTCDMAPPFREGSDGISSAPNISPKHDDWPNP
jgi:uncharacterized protein YciI